MTYSHIEIESMANLGFGVIDLLRRVVKIIFTLATGAYCAPQNAFILLLEIYLCNVLMVLYVVSEKIYSTYNNNFLRT